MIDEPSSLDIVGPCVSLPLEAAEMPSEPASPLARPPELAPFPRATDAEPFEAAVDLRTFLAARLTDGAGLSGDAPGITEALADDCQDQLGVDIIGPAGTARPEHCVIVNFPDDPSMEAELAPEQPDQLPDLAQQRQRQQQQREQQHAESHGTRMQIFVDDDTQARPVGEDPWSRQLTPLDVKTSDTIDDVKVRIQDREDFGGGAGWPPPHRQCLVHRGRGLEDGCTLADYDIQEGSTLFLMLRRVHAV